MTTLLIFEPSWHRVSDRLAALPPHEALLIGSDGVVRRGDGEVVPDCEVQPDVAWLNADMWLDPCIDRFQQLVLAAPKLRWVQSAAAGTDMPFIQGVLRKGARLCTSHLQARNIAESVIGRVLGHFQREPERAQAQAERSWLPMLFREVHGTSWLIVGFGSIGQAVAGLARGFGARIVGVRRTAGNHPAADELISPDRLRDYLPNADVVVLCLPLQSNEGLFDAEMFGAMKRDAVLVNVARGPIVDEEALVAALDRGEFEHAILDVFHTEPLPATHPLWAHPRVTISAHTTGMGNRLNERADALFLDNFGRFLHGEPLQWEYTSDRPA